MTPAPPVRLATRGSALAMAQAKAVLAECRSAFPHLSFELKVIKTTGDKLQSASMANPTQEAGKGLFTKELEVALLAGEADLAIHSLKDLPTELPEGLILAAASRREDARDVVIYRTAAADRAPDPKTAPANQPPALRGLAPHSGLADFPARAVIATSSTRRQAQLLAVRADLQIVPIRGNVGTRLRKLAERADLDGLVLAAAGLHRLGFRIDPDGRLIAPQTAPDDAPHTRDLSARYLEITEMIPCPGQAAIGIETRAGDDRIAPICDRLNHRPTFQCVTAERAFLRAMGGGCLSPIAGYADFQDGMLRLRALSFKDGVTRRAEAKAPPDGAATLGEEVARTIDGSK